MLQLLYVSTLPIVDLQRQTSREVVGNYRILLVRDRVEEYLKHAPGLPPWHSIQLTQLVCRRLLGGLYSLPFPAVFNINSRGDTGWQGHPSFPFHHSFSSFASRMLCLIVYKQLLGFKKLQVFCLLLTVLYFVHTTRDKAKKCIKKIPCVCWLPRNGFTVDPENSWSDDEVWCFTSNSCDDLLMITVSSAHCQGSI